MTETQPEPEPEASASPKPRPPLRRRIREIRRRIDPMRALARKRIQRECSGVVLSGPFQGLRYLDEILRPDLLPKLLGTYEKELHPWLEELLARPRPIEHVINVGAAEGYYATGFALRLPEVEVLAFEMDPVEQRRMRRLTEQNGVADRVSVAGLCDVESLGLALGRTPGALVVMDVEGEEVFLLDPQRVPRLRGCPILLELHDHLRPGLRRTMEDRFRGTHSLRVVEQQHRHGRDLPFPGGLLTPWLVKLLDEHRGHHNFPMRWMLMEPGSGTS